METKIKLISGTEDLTDAFWLREQVFSKEQGFASPDSDAHDPESTHIVIYIAEQPAATGRFYQEENGTCHIGRICVAKQYRKLGLGKVVMEQLEQAAHAQGMSQFLLSAQLYAVPFYERCGFVPTGKRHMDEFCLHEWMVKTL
ncbi:MAG: GNAT family N-acetyltransferase [Anaerotruncus sp.]|nr:GNAT family N-acetyltransferase [Anaerotruncus sp.]